MPTSNSCLAARRITKHIWQTPLTKSRRRFCVVCRTTQKHPSRAVLPLGRGVIFARKILLLVFVDLDIARSAFILPEQQNSGQGDSQSGEDGEQSFENFHGLVPPCEVRERSGGRSACHVRYSIAYSRSKGKRQKVGFKAKCCCPAPSSVTCGDSFPRPGEAFRGKLISVGENKKKNTVVS